MKVALVLIPDGASDRSARHLAAMAGEAGWGLHVSDDADAALSRLRELVARVPADGVRKATSPAPAEGTADVAEDSAEPAGSGGRSGEALERARRRSSFLSAASALLVSSVDYRSTLTSIARSLVPELADWCLVDLLAGQGLIERLVTAHADPERAAWGADAALRHPYDPAATRGVPAVLRTARSAFHPTISDAMLASAARSDEELALLREVGFTSAIIAPILVAGRVPVGAITLISAESARRYTIDDLTMAEELARRAATAIENARLYDELRQGRELLHVTLSSIGEGVVTTDGEGRIAFMNGVAESMTGWLFAEASGRSASDVVVVADGALVARDGGSMPVDASTSPILDTGGAVRGVVMVLRDATERTRAEAERARFNDEIALQRARLRSIVQSIPGVVWEAWGEPDDALQRIDFVSDYVETMLGYSVEEWLATPNFWLSIVHPDDQGRAAAEAAEIFASASGGTSRFRWMRRDGIAIWVEATSAVVCDDAGRPIGMRGVTIDVTARVVAEQELRAHGERLELLSEVERALSAELDMRSLVQRVTDAATRLCGAAYGAFLPNVEEGSDEADDLLALSGLSREAFERFARPRAASLFAPTFEGRETVRIDDVAEDPRHGGIAPHNGLPPAQVSVRSYLAVPVIARSEEVLGALFFGHPEPGVFTELDERLVTALAAQAAIAMDNARLYRDMQLEIEERRRAQEEVMRARDDAEAANRAKDQFLAVLSHELRTPLTPVLAVTHVLENDDRVAADQRPLIEMIRRNIELEARLIDDLLDLTRISKGKLSLTFETIDVHRLVNSVAAICRSDVLSRHQELAVDLQARDHFIRGDSARIQQVLWNLVKNAIKFTPEGGRITVRTLNDRPGHLRIDVVDTGIGIEPAQLPRIFNAFDQGSVDMRTYGGLGLGLSISRSLIEMHGGTLSAWSDGPGLGSTFAVEVDTVVRLRVEGAIPAVDGGRRAVRVLIVDDHIETSKVMKLLLERRGYQVKAAHTLHDALEATRTGDFDLLISDIGLPDGSGLELMRALADRPIRGIALSGFGMEEDIARSREAGFAEHLIKPVSFQSLQETIGRVLG